jgi:hypothetical protein
MAEADAVAAEATGRPTDPDGGEEEAVVEAGVGMTAAEATAAESMFGGNGSAAVRLEAALEAFLALEDPATAGWEGSVSDARSAAIGGGAAFLQRAAEGAATATTAVFRRAPPWPGGQVEVARGLLLDALRSRGAFAQAQALFARAVAPSGGSELPACHALLCSGVATQQSGNLATAAKLYAAAVAHGEAALQTGTFPTSQSGGGDGNGDGGMQEAPLDDDARATLQHQVLKALLLISGRFDHRSCAFMRRPSSSLLRAC